MRGDILGHWDLEWRYTWTQLAEAPSIIEAQKIKILAKVGLSLWILVVISLVYSVVWILVVFPLVYLVVWILVVIPLVYSVVWILVVISLVFAA